MKDHNDPVDREEAHPTVADSFTRDESEPIVQGRAGDVWTDFVRQQPEKREPEPPRQNGSVPLLVRTECQRDWRSISPLIRGTA